MTERNPFLSRSSFVEVYSRFALFNPTPGPRPNVHTYETEIISTDGNDHKARIHLYWPGTPPPDGTCISALAMMAYNSNTGIPELTTSKDEAELAWGDLTEPSYIERNLVTCVRLRVTGQCIEAEHDYVLLYALVYINGSLQECHVKGMINRANGRFVSLVGPKVGDVCGFRGKIESVETHPRRMFVIQLESYSSPSGAPHGQASTTRHTPGSAASRWKQARERALRDQAESSQAQDDAPGGASKRSLNDLSGEVVEDLDPHKNGASEDMTAAGRTKKARKVTVKATPVKAPVSEDSSSA
ncbi:hypothetical protein OC842_002760 [Tilletia horrida]|uniref:Uncharacterized protein n=1 Tax=Tilletia horrida TaxID=155126 RepID=A0AAN6JM00_9BASI|nr:hypothetical protein OC842_002760 [Tilletia horrida]